MTVTNGETTVSNLKDSTTKKVFIQGQFYGEKTLPSLNDAISQYSRHPQAGGKMKDDCKWICISAIRKWLKGYKVTNPPIILHYKFYEPNRGQKRDVMNIFSWADKCFEDALTDCKIIDKDNPEWVSNATHEFFYTDGEPYIEVEIEERGKKE